MNQKSRILLYDIETTPLITYKWGIWDEGVIKVVEEWYMLCLAYKWLGDKRTRVIGLPNFKTYSKQPKNDIELIKELWKLFDEAEIAVAHNGNKFDQKKAHARFAFHKLGPPSPYKQVDTRLLAKRYFSFTSNKLDDLGQHLGIGQKLPTGGFSLWEGCMRGDKKSWKTMMDYNKQDVDLLEKVYLELRPWDTAHPNVNFLTDTNGCPKCLSTDVIKQGFKFSKLTKRQQYRCKDCGGWFTGRDTIRSSIQFTN